MKKSISQDFGDESKAIPVSYQFGIVKDFLMDDGKDCFGGYLGCQYSTFV
jgi:hypothetical protein